MGAMSGDVGAGNQTTRLGVDERAAQIRADRDADALRYLTRRGHDDLLPILGLVESPPPIRTRRPSRG